MTEQHIEIPRSKIKHLLGLMGSLVFIAVSIWLLTIRHSMAWPKSLRVLIICIVGVGFFGLCAVLIIKNLFDARPGLVIDAEGVIDNTNFTNAGLISWADITGIAEWRYNGQKMVVLVLRDPQCYLYRVPNALRRKGLLFNLNNCGSPVVISANSLKISYQDLYLLLREKFDQYGSPY